MLRLPTRNGWMVSWYTGEVKKFKLRNGHVKEVRMRDTFESTSKEKVIQKKQELEANGKEIELFTECIF